MLARCLTLPRELFLPRRTGVVAVTMLERPLSTRHRVPIHPGPPHSFSNSNCYFRNGFTLSVPSLCGVRLLIGGALVMAQLPDTFVRGFHEEDELYKMEYVRMGRTDMCFSKIGLGGGAMSGFYNEFEDDEAIETVVEAVRRGINYIDTAPYYGQGRSEAVLGKALRRVPREAYYISTKVGRYTKDWDTMFDYSEAKVTSGLDNSLKLLGIDYVDVVVVHDIEFPESLKQILEETLPAVEKLKEAGKVKHIAVSGYPVSRLWEAVDKCQTRIDLVLSYSRDTLIDATLHDYTSKFQSKGVGVINAAPTAMSMLTNYGPQPWHPADTRTKEICAKAVNYCKENGVELGKLALYHTVGSGAGHSVLVGMNTREILKSNLKVVTEGLDDKERQVLQYLQHKIFPPRGENLHWEGVEIAQYRKHERERANQL